MTNLKLTWGAALVTLVFTMGVCAASGGGTSGDALQTGDNQIPVQVRLVSALPVEDGVVVGFPIRWENGHYYSKLGWPQSRESLGKYARQGTYKREDIVFDLSVPPDATLSDVAHVLSDLASIAKPEAHRRPIVINLVAALDRSVFQ